MVLSYLEPLKIKFILLQHPAPPPAIRASTRPAAVSTHGRRQSSGTSLEEWANLANDTVKINSTAKWSLSTEFPWKARVWYRIKFWHFVTLLRVLITGQIDLLWETRENWTRLLFTAQPIKFMLHKNIKNDLISFFSFNTSEVLLSLEGQNLSIAEN